ncbi:hypothetical protein EV649_0730 [Kribbella sp. VKM Ac-2569]|nr:hypothetical protein EV649_0730 [Kribbella sp. VKM Ac-2569]
MGRVRSSRRGLRSVSNHRTHHEPRSPAAARNHPAATSRARVQNRSGATTASPNHPAHPSRPVRRETPSDARTLNAAWKLCGVRTLSNAKQLGDAKRPDSARRLSGGRVVVTRLGLRRFGLGRRRRQLLVCGTTGICRTRVPSTRATHRSTTPASNRTYLVQPARSAPADARASSRTPPARSPQNKPPHTEPAVAPNQPRATPQVRLRPKHRPPTHPRAVQLRQLQVQSRVVRRRFRRTAEVQGSRLRKARLLVTG